MSRIPQFFIQQEGQEEFELTHYRGLDFYDLVLQSPQPKTEFHEDSGVDGEKLLHEVTFAPRTVNASFTWNHFSDYNRELACHELWAICYSRKPFYIRCDRNPALRMKVVTNPFDISRIDYADFNFSIDFTILSGFRESVVTSSKLMTVSSEKWQIGMNLPLYRDIAYTHYQASFDIYNPSDIPIEPWEKGHDLDIILSCEGTPIIENKTNGSKFSLINKVMKKGDTLILHGVHPFLNERNCGLYTDHGDIKLEKGDNQITIASCRNITVTFDFTFLYF